MSSDDKKQKSSADNSFLNAAARAVGGTLGKLAAKTGLAGSDEKPQTPAPAARPRRKKKAVAPKTAAKKTAAKKKTPVSKKTSPKPAHK